MSLRPGFFVSCAEFYVMWPKLRDFFARELLTLIDRKFSRELPVQPDYTGRSIDTIMTQKVVVDWNKNEVVLIG